MSRVRGKAIEGVRHARQQALLAVDKLARSIVEYGDRTGDDEPDYFPLSEYDRYLHRLLNERWESDYRRDAAIGEAVDHLGEYCARLTTPD